MKLAVLGTFALAAVAVVGLSPTVESASTSKQVAGWSEASDLPVAPTLVRHKLNERSREDLRCLALNIYFEARSEPVKGQVAVATVTMNRVNDRRFPDNICGVVRQGGEIRRHRCQFSWWCDGKRDDPRDAEAWQRANTLARLVAAGVIEDPTDGALWYHADYVDPFWADAKQTTTKIGRHIFYVLPPKRPVELSDAEARANNL